MQPANGGGEDHVVTAIDSVEMAAASTGTSRDGLLSVAEESGDRQDSRRPRYDPLIDC